MDSSERPKKTWGSTPRDHMWDSSDISLSLYSSNLSDGRSLLTAEKSSQDVAQMHGLPRWNQSMKLHCDFISFLAICQWQEIDFLGLTWQPALRDVGRGATAHVHQSSINAQTSFAFKRVTPSTYESDEHSIFRALITEVLILGHPIIRAHQNIVSLIGVCWDLVGTVDLEYTAWPVLVYEKAGCGDLSLFMKSEAGKSQSLDERLDLCVNIGTALMVMHSTCRYTSSNVSLNYESADLYAAVVHGDVNPRNILIFKDSSAVTERYIAKVADFGFSSLATTNDWISAARTRPWNAPEWHHRGFTIKDVQQMDIYSFGMLCLWLLIQIVPSKDLQSSVAILKDWNGDDLFNPNPEASSGLAFLEMLKSTDQMSVLAREIFMTMAGLTQGRVDNLTTFFASCLAHTPSRRSTNLEELLRLLSANRQVFQPNDLAISSLMASSTVPFPVIGSDEGSEVYLPSSFQVARSFTSLMDVDFRVRRYLFRCIKRQATNYHCETCSSSAALQTALCYKIGFGVPSDEHEACHWLRDDYTAADLEREIEILRDAIWSYTDNTTRLMDEGYELQMDHPRVYQRDNVLDVSEKEYSREIEDFGKVLGRSHRITRRLKSTLAGILFQKDEYEKAEILFSEIKVQLENNPEYGPQDLMTLMASADLAGALTELGKYEAAEELHLQVLAGYEKLLGPLHPTALYNLQKSALLANYQGRYEEAEIRCRRALEGEEAVLGTSHRNTLDTLNTLGVIFTSQGRYEKAMEVHRRELHLTETTFGQESTPAFFAISSLAAVSREQGKMREAEQLSRRAIQGLEKILGKENSDTLSCVEDLAWILVNQGQYTEAEQLFRQVLAGREKIFGPEHPEVLSTLDALAVVTSSQGHHKHAEETANLVIKKKREVLGPEHPDTLTAINNLATTLFAQGKFKAAEELYRDTLEIRGRLYKDMNSYALTNMNDLAVTLAAQGKYSPAATLYKDALAGRRRCLGLTHPDSLSTQNNLAVALSSIGQRTEAESLLRDILGHEATLSSSDVDTSAIASAQWNLADLLHRQKRFDEAYPLYEHACEGLAQRPMEQTRCATQFTDMQKEMRRRARGGIWKFDILHAVTGLSEVAWESLTDVLKIRGK